MAGKVWSDRELALLRSLKQEGRSWREIANTLGRTKEAARSRYKRIVATQVASEEKAEFIVPVKPGANRRITFGVISDTHFGSKYTVQAAIEEIPPKLVEEGAQFICFLGDLFDGVNVYAGQHLEQIDPGADGQLALAVKCFPRLPVPVYLLGGNHDFSFQRMGLDNMKRFAAIRTETTFLAYFQADLILKGGIRIRLFHPRGKLSKSRSRCVQNAIEAFIPDAPGLLLIGHYHWAFLALKYLGVWAILAPAFQRTTPYLKRQGQKSQIGGILVSFAISPKREIRELAWRYFEYYAY